MINSYHYHLTPKSSLNKLYTLINKELDMHIDSFSKKEAIYRDFRAGDIRHSNANISKAQNFVGYALTHTIYQGMEEAIEWYIENIGKK